jgi:hypothetical protein
MYVFGLFFQVTSLFSNGLSFLFISPPITAYSEGSLKKFDTLGPPGSRVYSDKAFVKHTVPNLFHFRQNITYKASPQCHIAC